MIFKVRVYSNYAHIELKNDLGFIYYVPLERSFIEHNIDTFTCGELVIYLFVCFIVTNILIYFVIHILFMFTASYLSCVYADVVLLYSFYTNKGLINSHSFLFLSTFCFYAMCTTYLQKFSSIFNSAFSNKYYAVCLLLTMVVVVSKSLSFVYWLFVIFKFTDHAIHRIQFIMHDILFVYLCYVTFRTLYTLSRKIMFSIQVIYLIALNHIHLMIVLVAKLCSLNISKYTYPKTSAPQTNFMLI